MSYIQQSKFIQQGVSKAVKLALLSTTMLGGIAYAEESETSASKKVQEAFEVIEVTARKKTESINETPLAITAFGESQLEAMRVKVLTDVKANMPNVVLEANRTVKGAANFSIRGLGVAGSIPSIEPTVGLFVDGIYMGTNLGVMLDTFDLESIEVLRGPQGTLFGRNVIGGAVLLNTKDAQQDFDAKFKVGVDGGGDGGNQTTMLGDIGGEITDDV